MSNIYLDENLSKHVANALNSLNIGYFSRHKVFSTLSKFKSGETDEVIIPAIGSENGVLITRDYKIKTSFQYELCKKYNLSVIFMKPAKNQFKHWDMVRLLIKHWEKFMEIIDTQERPFAYTLTIKGLTKLKM